MLGTKQQQLKKQNRNAFSNLLDDKDWAHKHTCIMFPFHACLYVKPGAQVFLTLCYIIMQICDSNILFFPPSLLGILMRACIDGSSGKRHFMSCGQTNSDVNALLKMLNLIKIKSSIRISINLSTYIYVANYDLISLYLACILFILSVIYFTLKELISGRALNSSVE